MSALRTALAAAAALLATEAAASDLTVHEISLALAQATPDAPADFSDKDLGGLDLSDLDFRGANLAGANLTAADLTDANLSRSNLARAQLDRAIVIRTNFAGADLSRTSLVWLVAFSGLEVRPDEAPNFAGADLSGARIFARLSGSDLNRAHLANARIGSDERTPKTMNLFRTELSGCNLSRADLAGADLTGALLSFADLSGATLSGANLYRADLSQADLTNADLTSATLSGADLEGAILRNVGGLGQAIGLENARNRDKAIE
jgi:uncharacterized protein YjbI with pentapeptide repeats